LIEQWLKGVVIRAINQRDIDVRTPEPLRGFVSAEPSTNNYDPRTCHVIGCSVSAAPRRVDACFALLDWSVNQSLGYASLP
jgi:hypothetical protein